jgi:tetratricopeptide (TPR) repeat protein
MSLLGKWFGFARDEVFDEGMAAFDRGAFEDAIDAFEECLHQDPEPNVTRLARFYLAESYAQLGQERLQDGNPLAALRHFEAALHHFPAFPDLNLCAARACREIGARQRAAVYVERALQSNGSYVEAILLDAVLRYEDGRADEALVRAREAVELEPGIGQAHYEHARECHAGGEVDQVVRHLLTMASTISTDAALHARVADSYMRDSMYNEAIEEYRKALSIAPQRADLRCRLGQALLAMGRAEEAVHHLTDAVRLNPASAEALAQLGLAQRALGHESEALVAFQRARALNPDHPVAVDALRHVRGYAS